MGDIPDWCCAAGICCNILKRLKAFAEILSTRLGLMPHQSHDVAILLTNNLDMMPKAAGLESVVAFIRSHQGDLDAEGLKTAMAPVIAYIHAHPYK